MEALAGQVGLPTPSLWHSTCRWNGSEKSERVLQTARPASATSTLSGSSATAGPEDVRRLLK